MRTFTIIGGGVSAYYALYCLNEISLDKNKEFKILWIKGDHFHPNVSPHIIPIITQNGIEKGVSPLGDLLFDSYFTWRDKFFKSYPFISEVNQYCFFDNSSEHSLKKFLRRHKVVNKVKTPIGVKEGVVLESFFVDASQFNNSIEESIGENSLIDIEVINDVLKKIAFLKNDHFELIGVNSIYKPSDVILNFSGVSSKFLPVSFLDSTKLEKHKVSTGEVIKFNYEFKNQESFILTQEDENLIYDSKKNIVQVSCSRLGFKNSIAFWSRLMGVDLSKLPFYVYRGNRDKGHKRLPYELRHDLGSTKYYRLCACIKTDSRSFAY